MPTIVIDAGHGGSDPGAVQLGRNEKDDNLRLALTVSDKLKELGYNVIMTRDSDEFISLLERSKISNEANADYFISLHRNSSTNPAFNGVETYVYTSPSAQSLTLANNIQTRLASAGVQTNLGVKYANFSVLRETDAPSVLVELGFVSNAIDNELFDTRFNEYADAIVDGIVASAGPASPSVTDRRAQTKKIQQALNDRYGTGLVVDGYFGPLTKKALVTALQKELNWSYNASLVVDGIFGPKTKSAIPNVRFGDNGYLVYLLQAMLLFDGYSLDVDGIFGGQTKSAVTDFQASKGLSTDGIAGKNTFEALVNSL